VTITASPAPPVTVHRAMPPAGMAGGLGAAPTGNLRLAGEHFAASILFLLAGSLGLIWIAPELATGRFLEPRVAGITHLFTLGWLTTTIFGALYQLLPVALGAPVRWLRVGHVSFATFVPGVAIFVAGVATSNVVLHHVGIALVATGIILVLVNIGASLAGATRRDVTWSAVALALTFLASTLVLGIVLLHNIHTGFLAEARLRTLAMHLHVALAGWVLIMIVGMAHRLLPMFLLAHGVDSRWTSRAVALLAIGVVVLVSGLAWSSRGITWIGAALLEGGLAAFIVQSRLYFKHRVRRRIDVGMRFVATSLVFMALGGVAGAALLAQRPVPTRLAVAYLVLGLLGGIVLFVIGQFYKIVPFLAWIARFRARVGKEKLPAVADLYSARVALVQWGIMVVAVIILVAGTLAGHPRCVRMGAGLFSVGTILLFSQIVRVARGPIPEVT
jgi:hypothetical protein